MTKIILYIAISDDGFIANKQGGVAWLDEFSVGPEFHDFYNSINALAIGNNTYKQILTFGLWPYPGKKSYIFSGKNAETGESKTDNSDIELGFYDVPSFVKKITTQNIQRLWLVGGAELAYSFYKHEYVDEYIIAVVPKKLDEGIALPAPLLAEKNFTLTNTVKFPSGMIQNYYKKISAGLLSKP